MTQNIVREQKSEILFTEAPLWMQTILNNSAAYGDFLFDLTKREKSCDSQVADFLARGEDTKAKIMLGKREVLVEMRHIVEAYRKEEVENAG